MICEKKHEDFCECKICLQFDFFSAANSALWVMCFVASS